MVPQVHQDLQDQMVLQVMLEQVVQVKLAVLQVLLVLMELVVQQV